MGSAKVFVRERDVGSEDRVIKLGPQTTSELTGKTFRDVKFSRYIRALCVVRHTRIQSLYSIL